MTNMKSILLAAALGLSSMTIASATSYNMVLSAPSKAGSVQLAAGIYKLNVEGRFATFTNVQTNKSVMVLYRRDTTNESFEHTAVDLKNEGGSQRIESIELENSNSKLEF